VGAIIFGFAFWWMAAFVMVIVGLSMGASQGAIDSATRLAGSICLIVANLICGPVIVGMALRKRYTDFRLALMAVDSK
jgi:hypothetical protein